MKVKTLKTVSAFGETINQGSIFEGDIKDFPKCIRKEIEMKAGTVIIMVEDEVKEKKEKVIQAEEILAESHVEEHLAKELELEEEKQKEEVKKEDEFPAAPPASSKKKAPKKTTRKKK